MDDSSSDEDGITKEDLDKCIKKVKGKITVIKSNSFLKRKQRSHSRIRDLNEMTEDLKAKGIAVNEESLATRVKNPVRIAELEKRADMGAKLALGESDNSDDENIEADEKLKDEEGEKRGRKGR